jgi:uncharacterized protein (TIGR03435 family)
MLRTLLEDRFALRARIETKKGDVTVIRLAKPEKLGPGLRRSTGDCRGPFTDVLPGEGTSRPPCPFTNTSERIQAEAVTMTEAARLIAQLPYMRPRAPLLDQTGLPDLYDVSFSLRRGRLSEDFLLAELEGQLGLKLHKTSMPLPTLIIGGAKKPRTD